MPLPRPQLNGSDGVHVGGPRYERIHPMFKDILEAVEETGLAVLYFDDQELRIVGFRMEEASESEVRYWEWAMHIDDLVRDLKTRRWERLIPTFQTAQGRAEIAQTLSKGGMPGYPKPAPRTICFHEDGIWHAFKPGAACKAWCGKQVTIGNQKVIPPTCPECKKLSGNGT